MSVYSAACLKFEASETFQCIISYFKSDDEMGQCENVGIR